MQEHVVDARWLEPPEFAASNLCLWLNLAAAWRIYQRVHAQLGQACASAPPPIEREQLAGWASRSSTRDERIS